MSPLTVAFLGVEHPHAEAHLRTLHQLTEVDQVYIWAESDQAETTARRFEGAKVKQVTTDLDKILARDELAYAIVSLPNDRSADICRKTLDAGTHVIAEKPLGRDAAEAESVVAAADRNNRKLGVCYQNRYHPLIREAKDLHGRGLLGPLMSVEMRMLTTQVQFRNPEHWLFNKEAAGGGLLSWLGCHYLDMIRHVTQDEIVSVMAETATRSGENIDVEDVVSLSMRLRSGAVASLHAGYILALSGAGYHNKGGYDTYAGFNGRTGRMNWTGAGVSSRLFIETTHPDWRSAPTRHYEYDVATSPAYGGVSGEEFMRDFIRATRDECPLPAAGRDALQIARIVDAAYESSQSGRRVEIEPPSPS